MALYPPRDPRTGRWYFNVALPYGIGCGNLADIPGDAPPEDALREFRRHLEAFFDVPTDFELEEGDGSWGATFGDGEAPLA